MGELLFALLVTGMITLCYGQMASTTTPQPPSNTSYPFQDEERGLIVTTYHDYGDEEAAQLRHLPIYPAYENFSGLVPGIGFTNPNIHFMSIDVDFSGKRIFAYDYHLRAIAVGYGYNKDLNVSQMEFDFMHVGVSRGTIQVAYDWLSGTLYWSDYVFRWIVAAATEKEKIENDIYAIIVDKHLDGPDGIAVDPREGYLFWSDNGKHPKIERSNLQGKQRKTIVTKNLKSPLTLEADIFEKRIFWIDSYSEAILSTPYDGGKVTQIQRIPSAILLDLGIFREVVYVSDISNSEVYSLNKTIGPHLGKSESTDISIYPEIIYGLAVYGNETQPRDSIDYCAKKNCDHICVSVKNGAECICSVGYILNKNSGKCEEVYKDYHKAIVVANATHICLLDIRSFAHVGYDYLCKFSVIKQKQPPTTSMPPAAKRRKRQAASTSLAPMTSSGTMRPSTATLTSTTPAPTAAPGDLIKMFAVDMENRIIYFVTASNTIYKRPLDLPIENDAKELVVVASGNISGIAFDSANKNNLYWCESDTGHVYVIDLATTSPRNIISDNMGFTNPRDLIVIYLKNSERLALLTGNSGKMSIQTFAPIGEDFKTVVETATITAFTYDTERQSFYYVSGRYVYSVGLDGSNRTREFSVDSGVFHLLTYKNYIVWLFASGSYSHLVRTYDLVTENNVALGYFDNSTLVDLKVLDTTLQTVKFVSPCAYENGNCSQICVTKYDNDVMTAVCECRAGYRLSANKKSCVTSPVSDFFILVSDWTNEVIQQIDLKTDDIHVIPGDDGNEYMGVFYDPDEKKVIYAEYYDSKIISMNLTGSNRRVRSDLGYSGYAYRFDKDMTTKNLYFTSYYGTFVGAVLPNGDYISIKDDFSYYETLNDIVVHPRKGWMYYTVTSWSGSYVGRSDMDGQNSVKLIVGDHVDTPDGLAIDHINDHLYWSDAKFDTITRCNLTGQNCSTIVNMTGTYRNEEIRDLEIDGQYLYYSAYKKDHVVRVDLLTEERTVVGQNPGLGKLDTMTYYSSANKNIQQESLGCRDRGGLGDCSTICLPVPSGRNCGCEKGISLKADGRTCSNIYQCTDLIKQEVTLATNLREMIDITFSDSCLRHLGDKCKYKCPTNYKALINTTLTCTKVGWDQESVTLCQEVRCPTTIDNGKISSNCKREIGEKCDYTCNIGFSKTQESAVCTKHGDGTYHTDDLCQPFQCNATIPNGILDRTCSRNIDSSCKYTCNKFFTPTDKKATALCKVNGWNPSDLCKEMECEDSSLAFGQVSSSCTKKVGEPCAFQCNQGYTNATSLAVCKNDLKWHPEKSCMPVRCPSSIANGIIDVRGSCDLSLGSICHYTCNPGFQAASSHANLMCQNSGIWNVTGGLCTELSITPRKQTQENNLSVPGVAVGVVVLILIIIALVGAIIYLIRRNMNKSSSNYASASFHQNGSGSGGIAIENPGYLQTNEPTVQVKDEHPYSSVDPSQMQSVRFAEGASAADDGIANPMYDKEPLPDVGHVDMHQDKTVLTYDSWLKERAKDQSGKY